MKIRYFFCGLLAISVLTALATDEAPRRFPHGCRTMDYNFEGDFLILRPVLDETPQSLYLIHNTSTQSLRLMRYPNEKFMPTYENILLPDEWGTFATNAMDQKYTTFQCEILDQNGGYQTTSCEETVELCEYNNVKFSEDTGGDYWVVKSRELDKAIQDTINQGILLRW